jgi:hypothetical protein
LVSKIVAKINREVIMPAKKKNAKTVAKSKTKPAVKSKTSAKPKTAAKKPAKNEKKQAPRPAAPPQPIKIEVVAPPAPPIDPKDLVDCGHCDATGKCAAGQPYDKSHHQGIFTKVILTSCQECLIAAGESHNSKKMVDCRFCKGTGKVPKTPVM